MPKFKNLRDKDNYNNLLNLINSISIHHTQSLFGNDLFYDWFNRNKRNQDKIDLMIMKLEERVLLNI
jgi:hypothetical protein